MYVETLIKFSVLRGKRCKQERLELCLQNEKIKLDSSPMYETE